VCAAVTNDAADAATATAAAAAAIALVSIASAPLLMPKNRCRCSMGVKAPKLVGAAAT
jgi:hypothetical protein